ncbi:gas vesicle protein [Brachybacterium sp. FME24]|uniref:gas vesicle protein GvpO n=1 Tax=Brachybacterium sp. FME24 TaxID=2742605 RepID=UPI001867DF7C|nr:gas vesicle protein [Brachybacterium sp. FME24]
MADNADENVPGDDHEQTDSDQSSSRRTTKRRVLTAKGAIRRATDQLEELTGRTPDSVIAVERQEDGWKVSLELVESRRIPDTTDILAEYSAYIDDRGELTSYRREARYTRGRVDG